MNGKIRLKDGNAFKFKSSNEAFIGSKISVKWENTDEIYKIVSSMMSRAEFDTVISSFVERGAVETDSVSEKTIEVNNGKDFRDYGNIKFDTFEINEAGQLPENLKKEILFLYYYGKNINYYKVLNVSETYNAGHEKVLRRCKAYRQLFAGRNFEGIELGNYAQKLVKVREIIKNACRIEDEDTRKKYDAFLMTTTPLGKKSEPKKETIMTSQNKANEHFLNAMKLNHEKEFQKAYNEIMIAIHLDHDNKEYVDFKNEIAEKMKDKKTEDLFKALENNDTFIFDESKLEKTIDEILEFTDDSAQTHMRLAQIALSKEMPEMAIEHAVRAVSKDPDLKGKVDEIVKTADIKMKSFNSEKDGVKTFMMVKKKLSK